MAASLSPFEIEPSYNAALQTFQPVVRLNLNTREREIVMMRWGLISYWSRDEKIGFRTINAKAETIATAPAFRETIKNRCCVVPAETFYEWQKLDAKTKTLICVCTQERRRVRSRRLVGTRTRSEGTRSPQTFTIVTADWNELVAPLHDRMPVVCRVKL